MDVFTENRLNAAINLAEIRRAKSAWGTALVRTDLTEGELSFLSRSFRGCIEREKKASEELRDAHGMLRAVNRMGR